jgi:hypothetical protein
VTEGWRKKHNEELHNLYSSPHYQDDQIKDDDMARTCSKHGEMRNVYKILAGKPEGTRPLRRPWCRSEDNIKTNHRETGFEGVD